MAFFLVSLLFLLFLPHTSVESCYTRYCGSSWIYPSIHFPFYLRGDDQSKSCGYPGFEVFCSKKMKNQTLLTLPNAGDFAVKDISYFYHKLSVNDPDDCLPKRFLDQKNIDLTGSPFQLSNNLRLVNITFFNCSHGIYPMDTIPCLGNGNGEFSVVAMASGSGSRSGSEPFFPMAPVSLPGCQVISSAWVPFDEFSYGLYTPARHLFSDIQLQWIKPSCGYPDCEEYGSKRVKYGLGFGLGIPAGLIFIIAVCLFYAAKLKVDRQRREAVSMVESNNPQQPSVAAPAMVANETNIERYPKTEVEDGGGLPNPNDNVCSICLCEYQPKEILRIIPDCYHYFHGHCLEGWLKINASCPLCRNLPNSSSLSSSDLSRSSSSL